MPSESGGHDEQDRRQQPAAFRVMVRRNLSGPTQRHDHDHDDEHEQYGADSDVHDSPSERPDVPAGPASYPPSEREYAADCPVPKF